jgi:HSP20 family protein
MEVGALRDRMHRMWGDRFEDRLFDTKEVTERWFPVTDILEAENNYLLSVDLPGVDPKDIEVRVDNDTLKIRGERRFENESENEHYRRVECAYGAFSRDFKLATTVDPENAHAEFKNGVLKLELPKAESAKARRIEIEAPAA